MSDPFILGQSTRDLRVDPKIPRTTRPATILVTVEIMNPQFTEGVVLQAVQNALDNEVVGQGYADSIVISAG